MKLIEFGEDIIQISFEFPDIEKAFCELFKVETKEDKIQHVSHFSKEMENKTILVVQTNRSLIFVSDLAEKELKFMKCGR